VRLRKDSNKGAATGMLLIAGALMYEWKIPINLACKGLRLAYKMEREKVEKAALRRLERRNDGGS